ncbi:hypothetical protein [Methanofervidicoccus abyssi]|uniref:Uncharacterized protein n=1 Tax=Methanofervidicoccus abyssi TaxID=2082189 RepID=A0A401HQQ5_9EURY|nr:hypothetical protein [Methanofervidicoccus abyssi]GBF36553.1 hypothetical protein MHHB_P0783 [Methanofervidicoccus abyssi]
MYARKALEKVSELDFKADYFLTPGGFLIIPWKFRRFEEAAEEGKLWVEKLFNLLFSEVSPSTNFKGVVGLWR